MPAGDRIAAAVSANPDALTRLRALARAGAFAQGTPPAPEERCDLCATTVPDDHRHLLQLDERRITCVCEACWALHSGDAEYRPTGMRTLWLQDFRCEEATWASLQIPIRLAFFMRSSVTGEIVGFYPSPAGAIECEPPLESWEALALANPVLARLDADGEALVVNRLSDPAQYLILPIDRCYELVGLIRSRWDGISGGDVLTEAVPEFFARVRAQASRVQS